MVKKPGRILKTIAATQTLHGNFSYLLTRSSRRKTLAICISEKGDIKVFAPFLLLEERILNFIRHKAHWIDSKVKEAKEKTDFLARRSFSQDQEFLFLGKQYKLDIQQGHSKRGRVFVEHDVLKIILPSGLSDDQRPISIKKQLIGWYREQAHEILGGRVFHFSRQIGVTPKRIAIRTQKRRWGTCDYNRQSIHLNWQIILSPLEVIDYVVVHELCHLLVPNHSKRFWGKVKKFLPGFKKEQQWLKENHFGMILA